MFMSSCCKATTISCLYFTNCNSSHCYIHSICFSLIIHSAADGVSKERLSHYGIRSCLPADCLSACFSAWSREIGFLARRLLLSIILGNWVGEACGFWGVFYFFFAFPVHTYLPLRYQTIQRFPSPQLPPAPPKKR
jgi:hypothetical protein